MTRPSRRCQSVLAVAGPRVSADTVPTSQGASRLCVHDINRGATPVVVTGRATRLTSLDQTSKWGDTRLDDSPIAVGWSRADQTRRPPLASTVTPGPRRLLDSGVHRRTPDDLPKRASSRERAGGGWTAQARAINPTSGHRQLFAPTPIVPAGTTATVARSFSTSRAAASRAVPVAVRGQFDTEG